MFLANSKRNWAELIGVFGVIVSLIFVGLEVRQNTAAVRGATYQEIANGSLQHLEWFAGNERLLELWVRIRDDGAMPSDFTPEQNVLIVSNYIMAIRRIENIYVQVREGLVDEDAVLRFRPSDDVFATPYFLASWKEIRHQMEPAFLEYFESEYVQ